MNGQPRDNPLEPRCFPRSLVLRCPGANAAPLAGKGYLLLVAACRAAQEAMRKAPAFEKRIQYANQMTNAGRRQEWQGR